MQGRQGQGSNGKNPLDRSATGAYRISDRVEQYRETGGTGAYRLSDLTGRQQAVPRRPPGMAHLDQPPPTLRVARPQMQRRERKPKTGKWWAGTSAVVVLAVVLVGMLVYGTTNFFLAISVNAGAASTAGDFLAGLQGANYDQAYNDLAPTLTAHLSRSGFKQMALADDHCYGQITDSNEVNGSAVTGQDGSQSFTYSMTRSKLAKPYQMQLTLQKDAAGGWNITSYGDDLGPAPPTCK